MTVDLARFDEWWTRTANTPADHDGPTRDGCRYPTAFDAFWSGTLGLCGCGIDEPKRVVALILWTLLAAKERDVGAFDLYPEDWNAPIVYFALHVLDSAGVVEHGSGVGGSWLTLDGVEIARAVVEERSEIPA